MEDSWNTSGIYMLTCKVNGKRYIGQSKNIKRRLNEHKNDAKNHRFDVPIHRAIRKYGWENFDKIVLKFCPVERLDECEIYYIARINPEYNISKGGGGSKGRKLSLKQRQNLSKVRMGNKCNCKPVICIETGEIFESLKMAAIKIGVSRASVTSAVRGKTKTCGGYHWDYLSEKDKKNQFNCYKKIRKHLIDNPPNIKKVICVETGKIFNSVKDVSIEIGLDQSLVSKVLNGHRKTAGGFHWKFENAENPSDDVYNDRRKKSVMCIETGEIFESVRIAAKYTGVHHTNISKVLKGKQTTAGGYHWKFIAKETD